VRLDTGRLAGKRHLPRHSIRALLVFAFVGLAVYLYRENQLFQPSSVAILGVVFSYLLGIVVRGVLTWWTRGRQTKTVQSWEDLKAFVVLSVLIYTAGAYLLDQTDLVQDQLRNATLDLVRFYFGSR
jgi:hypothetical protein